MKQQRLVKIGDISLEIYRLGECKTVLHNSNYVDVAINNNNNNNITIIIITKEKKNIERNGFLTF